MWDHIAEEEWFSHWVRSPDNREKCIVPVAYSGVSRGTLSGDEDLRVVVLSETVKVIGTTAFSWCPGLEYISIPESVTWIGCGAFHTCRALESIVIPDSVMRIGENAFSNCANLSKCVILSVSPFDLFTSFNRCPNLKTVFLLPNHKCRLPENITPILLYSAYITRRDVSVLTESQKRVVETLCLVFNRLKYPSELVWMVLEQLKINLL